MDTDIQVEPKDNEDKSVNNKNKSTQSQGIVQNGIKANKQECFRCKVCPYNTFREPFLVKHMLQKHGFAKVKDKKQDESFSDSDKIDIEVMRINGKEEEKTQSESDNNDDVTEFECELCNFKTRHLNLLNVHQEFHENQEKDMFTCIQCDFQTKEVAALQDHEKTHKKLHLFSCPNCDYATRQKCNLKAHIKIHEDPDTLEKFSCATCKKFVSFHYSALSRHIKMKHGIEGKVFKCDKCSFTAKIQRHLLNHQKVHASGEDSPMFKCEKCDFVTYNELTIQRHVQRHEERQRDGEEVIVKEQADKKEIIWFCCNMCEFKSKDQRYVILHKKVHTRVDEINKRGESIVQSAQERKIDISKESS